MSIKFDGKVAIVTGAGGGLGRSHALELARRGAKVVVNDLGASLDGSGGSSAAANKVVEEIRAMGGEAVANGASVTHDEGVSRMVQDTLSAFGRIDILINNAGVLRDKSFAKLEIEDFQIVVDVHLMGGVKVTKAVWPVMKQQGYGRILMTSSATGLFGNFGQTNYGAAKLGLVGFMNSLKLEGQKDNIRVNSICPVAFTRMTENLMRPEAHAAFAPEHVSAGALYLVSEDAPTGVILSTSAGVFAAVRLQETKGVALGRENLTPEKVAENWEKISDFTDGEAFFQIADENAKFHKLADY